MKELIRVLYMNPRLSRRIKNTVSPRIPSSSGSPSLTVYPLTLSTRFFQLLQTAPMVFREWSRPCHLSLSRTFVQNQFSTPTNRHIVVFIPITSKTFFFVVELPFFGLPGLHLTTQPLSTILSLNPPSF